MISDIVDAIQTISIFVLIVVLVFMNKGIRANANSITRLANTVTEYLKGK